MKQGRVRVAVVSLVRVVAVGDEDGGGGRGMMVVSVVAVLWQDTDTVADELVQGVEAAHGESAKARYACGGSWVYVFVLLRSERVEEKGEERRGERK